MATPAANVQDQLIGFSIRVLDAELDGLWSDERRRVHLIDPRIAHPLSIDDAVWPIPHDIEQFLDGMKVRNLGEVDANPFCLLPTIPREWLRGYFDRATGGRFRLIAATVSRSDLSTLRGVYKWIRNEADGLSSFAIVNEWTDLGIDVMDFTAISGLTNCGIGEALTGDERNLLVSQLNGNGLFSKESDARAFATRLNGLVLEHQPFIPVRLWLSKS